MTVSERGGAPVSDSGQCCVVRYFDSGFFLVADYTFRTDDERGTGFCRKVYVQLHDSNPERANHRGIRYSRYPRAA